MRCFRDSIRWQSAMPFLSESYTTILFSCCVTVIASGKRLWRRANALGCSQRSFLKAANSAAS